jgi:hypothetical protein
MQVILDAYRYLWSWNMVHLRVYKFDYEYEETYIILTEQ